MYSSEKPCISFLPSLPPSLPPLPPLPFLPSLPPSFPPPPQAALSAYLKDVDGKTTEASVEKIAAAQSQRSLPAAPTVDPELQKAAAQLQKIREKQEISQRAAHFLKQKKAEAVVAPPPPPPVPASLWPWQQSYTPEGYIYYYNTQTGGNIPYSRKLSREKTFAFLWQSAKVLSAKFSQSRAPQFNAYTPPLYCAYRESFFREILFFTDSRKFYPSKVSGYTVAYMIVLLLVVVTFCINVSVKLCAPGVEMEHLEMPLQRSLPETRIDMSLSHSHIHTHCSNSVGTSECWEAIDHSSHSSLLLVRGDRRNEAASWE